MSTSYPTSIQSIPNPTSTDLLENASPTLDHDYQHGIVNDTLFALQTKVGIDGSAVATSHSYKLSGVSTGDKAASLTGSETLTNKILTAPKINFGSDATGDIYYRTGAGVTARLAAGAENTILSISSGIPAWIANPAAADASTTVKGVTQEATLAQMIARNVAGSTSARLFVNPGTLTTVQTYDYAADSVGTDSYAITVTPAPTAYTTGMRFIFKAGTANTGACSLNVNSLGAKTIKKNYNTDLETGDILANQIVEVIYDGTNFQIKTSATGVDFNYISNSTPKVLSGYTQQLNIPTTAINGWTLSNTPSITSYPNGILLSKTSSNAGVYVSQLMGLATGTTAIQYSSGIDISMSYFFTPELTSNSGTGIGYTHGFGGSSLNPIITMQGMRLCFVHYGGRIYALSDNNSTVTTVDIMADPGAVKKRYTIQYNGTSGLFYIDGVLQATISTTMPTGDIGLQFSCGRTTGSVSFNLSHITYSETLS
mgnify:CR=1 FL=1